MTDYYQVTQRKVDKWLRISTITQLENDVKELSLREFNRKYQEKYRSNETLSATIRRIRNFLGQYSQLKRVSVKKEKVISKKGKIVNIYKEGKLTQIFKLKNVWKMKGGQWNISFQQLNIIIKFDLWIRLRNGVEKLIAKDQHISFSSRISRKKSFKELYKIARNQMRIWKMTVRQSGMFLKNVSIIYKVIRYKK